MAASSIIKIMNCAAHGGAKGIEYGVGFPSCLSEWLLWALPELWKLQRGDNNFPRAQLQPPVNNFYFSKGIASREMYKCKASCAAYFYISPKIPQWQYIKRAEDFCVVSWIFHLYCQGPCTSRLIKSPEQQQVHLFGFSAENMQGFVEEYRILFSHSRPMMEYYMERENIKSTHQAERQRSGPLGVKRWGEEYHKILFGLSRCFECAPVEEPLKRVAEEKNNTTIGAY
jgi:hypothetical protein